jgi:hypothetical protein
MSLAHPPCFILSFCLPVLVAERTKKGGYVLQRIRLFYDQPKDNFIRLIILFSAAFAMTVQAYRVSLFNQVEESRPEIKHQQEH